MDYNILNGGLITKINEDWIISDLKQYKTYYRTKTEGMFWFMNFDGKQIYYSDQRRDNALCKMDIVHQEEEIILNKPCYGLILHKNWIYYMNEKDKKIYRCLVDGSQETKVIDEMVYSFIIKNEAIIYSTRQGIRRSDDSGSHRNVLCEDVTQNLMLIGNKLIYTNKKAGNVLTIFDMQSKEKKVIKEIVTSSINTDGKYIYCIHRVNERSIYRIDPETEVTIRISSDQAEYLHIIDDDLVYCINKEWYSMAIRGGRPKKIERGRVYE